MGRATWTEEEHANVSAKLREILDKTHELFNCVKMRKDEYRHLENVIKQLQTLKSKLEEKAYGSDFEGMTIYYPTKTTEEEP